MAYLPGPPESKDECYSNGVDVRPGTRAPVDGRLLPEGEVLERECSLPAREEGEQAKGTKQAGEHETG